MADTLPRLRMDLDFMPSPSPDHPGLLLRDPMQFSDAVLVIPPGLIDLLGLFDGESDKSEIKAELMRQTGDLQAGMVLDQVIELLDKAGFLENDTHYANVDRRVKAFEDAPTRKSAHAGPNNAYPDNPAELKEMLDSYYAGASNPNPSEIRGIAAPHVSPFGGWESYRDAYHAARLHIGPLAEDYTFVILGTSHYGMPDMFGLTRKPFETPFGTTRTATGLVDELAAASPDGVLMEDFMHSIEHSIEFQVIFLQHLFGANIKILPILCGSFANSIMEGHGRPEDNPNVARFLDALGNLHAREGKKLFYVMGVDMAHVGRRYGDPFTARAGQGDLMQVAMRDRDRIQQMEFGDAPAFWERILENHDDLKWCGSSPIYTFLKACPDLRGQALNYQQWNIDEASVVTFAALRFGPASSPPSSLVLS